MNRLLVKASRGVPYQPRQQEFLYYYLGIEKKLLKRILYTTCFIIAFVLLCYSFGFFGLLKARYYMIIFVVLAIICPFIVQLVLPYKRRIKNYLKQLDTYYQDKLSSYKGYSIMHCAYSVGINSNISKQNVIFITDGYQFIIYEDFLKSTGYALPDYYQSDNNLCPMLKVYDKNSIYKQPVKFKIGDIYSYQLIGDYKEEENSKFRDYTKVYNENDLMENVTITLKDHTIYKLSTKVYMTLKKSLPAKEIKL